MKRIKQLAAILLSAILAAALAAPARIHASEGRFTDTKGEIVLEGIDGDQTFRIYKILDLVSFSDDDTDKDRHWSDRYAYAIAENSLWLPFVRDHEDIFDVSDTALAYEGKTDKYFTVRPTEKFENGFSDDPYDNKDETTRSEFTSASEAQKLAQEAIEYAGKEKLGNLHIEPDGEVVKPGTEKYTFRDVDLGYYVVSSTVGTLCALDTTNRKIVVTDKNEVPEIWKAIQENSLQKYHFGEPGDGVTAYRLQNDANVGDTVYYKTRVDVRKGAEDYIVYDAMDDGLTLDKDSFEIYLLTKDANEEIFNDQWILLEGAKTITLNQQTDLAPPTYTSLTTDDFYTVATKGLSKDILMGGKIVDPDFEIHFNQHFLTYLSDLISDTFATLNPANCFRLVILYSATLNDEAVMDKLGVNNNRTKVRYGDPKFTEEAVTSTATWSMRVFKFEQTEEEKEKIVDGAHFQILKDGKPLKFIYLDDGRYRFNSSDEVQHAAKSETTGGAIRKSEPTEHGYTVVDTVTTKKGTGILEISGLDGDTYSLIETYAPTGYSQQAGEVLFHIVSASEGTEGLPHPILYGAEAPLTLAETPGTVVYCTVDSTKAVSNEFDAAGRVAEGKKLGDMIPFENKTSTSLPKVGGMGTTIIYIVGGILVVGAGAYLIISGRKNKKDKK